MKVGFFLWETVNGRQNIASSRIRGKWLIKYWDDAEEVITGKKYDVIIFQKVYFAEYAKKFDGIKILDLCDPDWTQGAPIKEMIENVDAVTCSSQALTDFIRTITDKPVAYIPDRVDLNFYKEKKIHRGKAKECVWHGYSHNSGILKSAVESLVNNNLGLNIISESLVVLNQEKNKRFHERWTKWDLNTFGKEFIKSDIFVNPGSTKPNDRFKSNNRIVQSWSLGVPVAFNGDDLKRFLDPAERQKEADLRLEEVKKFYDVNLSVEDYKILINNLEKKKE